jgi:hypothetical protein
MLEPVKLADQWRAIESELPAGWPDAHARLQVSDPSHLERVAALLGPLNPVRRRPSLDVHVTRTNVTLLRRQLARLDAEKIAGELELLHVEDPSVVRAGELHSLVAEWDRQLETLPLDWSDAYVEVELESSDHIPRAALLLAPCNPALHSVKSLRFRAARRFGYGTSTTMVRRCLERLDEDGIRGSVRVLHVLSDTDPVKTQGPVWYVEGKAV